MKINETVKKSFTFSCEDAQLVHSIILEQLGKKTIKTALENSRWYLPLLSAYGKIAGVIVMMDYSPIQFSYDEKYTLCEILQKAWSEESDSGRKAKIQELLEGIFNNA